jgi:hypothetical protein
MEFLAFLGSAGFGAGLTYLLTHSAMCYVCTDAFERIDSHCDGQTTGTVCKTVFNTAPMSNDGAVVLTTVVGLAAGAVALILTHRTQQRSNG